MNSQIGFRCTYPQEWTAVGILESRLSARRAPWAAPRPSQVSVMMISEQSWGRYALVVAQEPHSQSAVVRPTHPDLERVLWWWRPVQPPGSRRAHQTVDAGNGVADGGSRRLGLIMQILEHCLCTSLATPHAIDRIEHLPHHLPKTRELCRHVTEGFQLFGHVVEHGGEFLERLGHLHLDLRRLAAGH